jgi:RNA polymerase sigma-70 factor (ECF subfamily)
MPSPDDQTAADGDAPAFDHLYRAEWPGIVALGWSLTGSWATAEELAQDAFADAYRRWDEVGGHDKPGAWVRRAVINRAASVHRRRHREEQGLTRWSSESATRLDGPATDHTGDRATDHVDDPVFWDAVRTLPERQAACVALHYLDDLAVADIAEVLGCRAATVKVHLHRGRQALARRLAAPSEATGTSPRPTTDPLEEAR